MPPNTHHCYTMLQVLVVLLELASLILKWVAVGLNPVAAMRMHIAESTYAGSNNAILYGIKRC